MRLGTHNYGAATLLAGRDRALPDHLSGIIEISALHVPEAMRRQGQATELMNRVCREADRGGNVLMLMPDGPEWLEHWYKQFGFVEIQAKPVILMARKPRAQA